MSLVIVTRHVQMTDDRWLLTAAFSFHQTYPPSSELDSPKAAHPKIHFDFNSKLDDIIFHRIFGRFRASDAFITEQRRGAQSKAK